MKIPRLFAALKSHILFERYRLRQQRQKLVDLPNNSSIIITMDGGLGTQILQSAAYFDLAMNGKNVFADLSYFDKPFESHLGTKGSATHWAWYLDIYDLKVSDFKTLPPSREHLRLRGKNQICRLDNRCLTLYEIGLNALSNPNISKLYGISHPPEILKESLREPFCCIHVRRGDYKNVASYLLPDEDFLLIAKKISILENLVVLSDEEISFHLKSKLRKLYKTVHFLEDISFQEAHVIMRHAKILVCSNSTFSLTAGLLNYQDPFIIIPTQWFGEELRYLEQPLHNRCKFQILD